LTEPSLAALRARIAVLLRAYGFYASITGAIVIGLSLAQTATATRGYTARACGFDLDDDGIVGEAVDDCTVCDSAVHESTGFVLSGSTDPDGDGDLEDFIYVDCEGGTNQPSCGVPSARGVNPPCLTLDYAFNVIADGGEDEAEDIVCFKGTCTPDSLAPRTKGATHVTSGFWTKAASGSQARSFEYPNNPAMLVGWDADADGSYPPFDADDTAVLDGGSRDLDMAIVVGQTDNGFFEMAHFSVSNYGNTRDNTARAGFLDASWKFKDITHHHYHDLEMNRINEGVQSNTNSFRMVFSGWSPGLPDHIAFHNLKLDNIGGWMWRGSGPGTEIGPVRFQNLTVKAHGQDGLPLNFVKKWGMITGVEILDSIFDANFAAWTPGRARGIGINMCAQDWDIKNNKFIDISHTLQLNGFEPGQCATRSVDDILFEDNEVVFTEPSYKPAQMFKIIGSGRASPSYVENVTVRNNTISSTGPSMNCVKYESNYTGALRAGTITFTGNTCDGKASTAMIYVDDRGTNLHDTWVIRDNNINDPAGVNIRVDYDPGANWNATNVNNNCYDSDGTYEWLGRTSSAIAEWRTDSHVDPNSVEQTSCP
jgi:hypothetical protein